ncbi:MAG TPA: hypothetical protein VFZ65_02805 [Planctomycetota bacterium]|nr:hypothetical protein [Planctomycetota bacterium]
MSHRASRRIPGTLLLAIGLLSWLAGCASPRRTSPVVRELYHATARREARNPVVVIHGMLGARLEQRSTGKTVWGAFTSDGIDPNTREGARALALPMTLPGEAGLASPDADRYLGWLLPDEPDAAVRRARANAVLAAHLARARAFHAALDQDPAVPCPAELCLFAADTIPTLARTRLVRAHGRLEPRFDGGDLREFGDGTVPRFSALADRSIGGVQGGWLDSPVTWSGVTFLPDDHLGLTSNPVFTDNLLFYLLEQRPRWRAASASAGDAIASRDPE